MERAGIRELKQNASAVVAAAKEAPVTITDRGTPVAVLSSIHETRLERLLRDGGVTAPKRTLTDLGMPAVTVEADVSAALAEERAAARY